MSMNNESHDQDKRVFYTCWPFGGVLCGIATVLLGGTMILSTFFPHSPEIVWGIALIVIGAIIALYSKDRL